MVSTLHPQTSAPVDQRLRGGSKPLRVGLFGCSLNTGNRGVTALAYSTIGGLHTLGVPVEVTLFDMGHGYRTATVPIQGGSVDIRLIGCFESKRYYRTSNLTHLRWANRLGLGKWHPMLKELKKLDAIFDISAGDSFSDIYGPKRFHSIVVSKLLAMEMGIPLVLTPQTYGPFRSEHAKAVAKDILQRANQVWARDAISMRVVKDLGVDVGDENKYKTGVDVAFGLPSHAPKDQKLVDDIQKFKESAGTLIGLNVSGLLYTNSGVDVSHYGFLDSYSAMTDELLQRLLALKDTKILLIPHVSSAHGRPDNDCDTTKLNEIYAKLPAEQKAKVFLVPPSVGPTEVKWVIAQCAWFCGTRMHACIAALSQGVPATAIAYSDKTLGVFETAHVGEAVVDPRVLHQEELIERIMAGMNRRELSAKALQARLPELKQEWLQEFQAIYQSVV